MFCCPICGQSTKRSVCDNCIPIKKYNSEKYLQFSRHKKDFCPNCNKGDLSEMVSIDSISQICIGCSWEGEEFDIY